MSNKIYVIEWDNLLENDFCYVSQDVDKAEKMLEKLRKENTDEDILFFVNEYDTDFLYNVWGEKS